MEFVARVNKFLDYFRLNRDRDALCQRAKQADGAIGSQGWYLVRSNFGEQLFSDGRYQDAAQVFSEILVGLSEQPSYERSWTLNQLGRCLAEQGEVKQAIAFYCQGLAVAKQLKASDGVKRLMVTLQTALADTFKDIGDYGTARIAYEQSLTLAKEMGDARGEAVVNGQLGTLALFQDNIAEAEQRYLEALTKFQRLNEPAEEAVFWHLLGMVYQKAEQWDAAEQAYREAACIHESQGNLADKAKTWNNLALVTETVGKLVAAEAWYRKAIEDAKSTGFWLQVSGSLSNLANLLQNQPNRLQEARQLAEEALTIKQTLDPAAAKIWNTYGILAKITNNQGDISQAKEYRRLSREAWARFAGAQYHLRKHGQLIAAVVTAVDDVRVKQKLETALEEWAKAGWNNLVAAIHLVLEGERDEDMLCELLNYEEAPIINAILRGIADPETLKLLLEGQG